MHPFRRQQHYFEFKPLQLLILRRRLSKPTFFVRINERSRLEFNCAAWRLFLRSVWDIGRRKDSDIRWILPPFLLFLEKTTLDLAGPPGENPSVFLSLRLKPDDLRAGQGGIRKTEREKERDTERKKEKSSSLTYSVLCSVERLICERDVQKLRGMGGGGGG